MRCLSDFSRTGVSGAGVRADFVLLGKCLLLHIGQSNGGYSGYQATLVYYVSFSLLFGYPLR